jgi:hypothetical protein
MTALKGRPISWVFFRLAVVAKNKYPFRCFLSCAKKPKRLSLVQPWEIRDASKPEFGCVDSIRHALRDRGAIRRCGAGRRQRQVRRRALGVDWWNAEARGLPMNSLHQFFQNEVFFLGLFAGLVAGFALGAAYGVMRGRIQVFDAMHDESITLDNPIEPADPSAAIRERMREIELMDPLMGRDL